MNFEIIIAAFAAFVAGFVDAIAGGGGVVTFPTLLMLGLPVSQIVGTNKLVSTCGTVAATITFWKAGHIDKQIARYGVPAMGIGALIGAITVLQVPNDFLKPLASVFILILAVYFFLKPSLGTTQNFKGVTKELALKLFLACLCIGFYDGFFGPGTGMFLTYFFVKVFETNFVTAAGNTKLLNLVSNVVPLCYFLTQGNIRYEFGIPMALANILGGICGARSAILVGPRLVRWIYIFMAICLSAKLLF